MLFTAALIKSRSGEGLPGTGCEPGGSLAPPTKAKAAECTHEGRVSVPATPRRRITSHLLFSLAVLPHPKERRCAPIEPGVQDIETVADSLRLLVLLLLTPSLRL